MVGIAGMGLIVFVEVIAVIMVEMVDVLIVGRIVGVIVEMCEGQIERVVIAGVTVEMVDVPIAHIPTVVEQTDTTTSQDVAEKTVEQWVVIDADRKSRRQEAYWIVLAGTVVDHTPALEATYGTSGRITNNTLLLS